MNVKSTIRIAGVTTVAVLLTAIVGWFASTAAAQPKDLPVVRYAMFKGYDPTFIAIEKGYFRDVGIDVQLVGNFPSGPAGVTAAAAGQLDAGLCAVTGLIAAKAAGINVKGIADIQTEYKKAPLQRFYVQKNSSISSVKDLKGKTVAVNSKSGSFYFALLTALAANGMSADDVKIAIIPQPNQEQALLSGQVDAIGLIDPFNRKAELDGGVRKLFNAVDYMGERHVSLLYFTNDYLAKNEAVVRKFIAAYRKAINFQRFNHRAAAGIEWKYIGVEPKYAVNHLYTPGAGVHLADVQFWLDFMRKTGNLNDGGKLTPASVASIRYAGKG